MFLRWLLTRAKLWTQSHQGLIQLRLFGDGWGPEGELVNRVHTHTFWEMMSSPLPLTHFQCFSVHLIKAVYMLGNW